MREAARDFDTYSSDLLGDRDVRAYRQLPLEADPPRHTQFRAAMQPWFMGEHIAQFAGDFEELARSIIRDFKARGSGEIAGEFALPFVIGCLGIIYNRPQDVAEWTAWGADVWTAEATMAGISDEAAAAALSQRDFDQHSLRSGKVLQAYLDRVFAEAARKHAAGEPATDIWDFVARLEVAGQPIELHEMWGIANVLLAGGRDTVIKLVTGLIWHLTLNPQDREFLAANPDWYNRTIGEMVRFLTPLPKMERAPKSQVGLADSARNPEEYVLLSFVSANYDKDVWQAPDRIDIHRERTPHLGFGYGRHSCMGMNITEHEVGALLRVLLGEWPAWQLDGEPEIEWSTHQGKNGDEIRIIDRFRSLRVTF